MNLLNLTLIKQKIILILLRYFFKCKLIMNQSFLNNYKWALVLNNNKDLLWYISWLLFDVDFEKVIWCIYKKSFLKYWYFLFEDILTKKDFEFIINENTNEKEFYEIIWKDVKNEDLITLWNIEDIDFDITYKLKNIYIDYWYIFSIKTSKILKKNIIKISKKAILSYEKDFIIIKDKQTIKENKKTFENISKIFINIPTPNYNINQNKYE